MAEVYDNSISVAFDMAGCPQRCRHCYLGHPAHQPMDAQEVMAAFEQIQSWGRSSGIDIGFLQPHFREPHEAPDYQELYSCCDRVNGQVVEVERQFELLNLERISSDPQYLPWVKQRGIQRCQLKLFGMEAVNNFFYGRADAHDLILAAVEGLLAHEIVPRWQIYLNTEGAAALDEVWQLALDMCLFERVEALGEEFNIHCMPYDADGSGYCNRRFRMRAGQECFIPKPLDAATQRHFQQTMGTDFRLDTEAELYRKFLHCRSAGGTAPASHWLWFFVTSDWNVYPNLMGPAPWWRLGNLQEEPFGRIVDRYVHDECLGLQVLNQWSPAELARNYGDPQGRQLFFPPGQVLDYWIGRACRDLYQRGAGPQPPLPR